MIIKIKLKKLYYRCFSACAVLLLFSDFEMQDCKVMTNIIIIVLYTLVSLSQCFRWQSRSKLQSLIIVVDRMVVL